MGAVDVCAVSFVETGVCASADDVLFTGCLSLNLKMDGRLVERGLRDRVATVGPGLPEGEEIEKTVCSTNILPCL